MKIRVLAPLVLALVALLPSPSHLTAQANPRTIEIVSGDDMQWTVKAIQAKPGETLRVVIKAVGKMPKQQMAHNFVLLAAGTDANAFVMSAVAARATGYIPAAKKSAILASTGLAGPGESVEVTFKVPTKPGVHDYLCSFPGHFAAGMRGKLTVK